MATDCTRKASPGTLAPKCRLMPSSGWMRSTRVLGCSCRRQLPVEGQEGHAVELQGHLGHPGRQALAGPHVDRHPGPAPVLDPQAQGHVGLGRAVRGRRPPPRGSRRPAAWSTTPAVYWPRTDLSTASSGVGMSTALSSFTFSSRMCWASMPVGRLHQGEGQHLHDVVLHDVAQRPGRLVEAAPVLDPDALGHRDLDLLDVAAVPDGLEDGVGEPQGQDVLDRLLAHVVVDAEDLVLVEGGVHADWSSSRALCQVAAVGLLDHQPGELAASPRARCSPPWPAPRPPWRTPPGWWPGSRAGCPAVPYFVVGLGQQLLQPVEGLGGGVLAGHVAEPLDQLAPLRSPGVGHVLQGRLAELLVGPLGAGHPDHREVLGQPAAVGQVGQRREDLARGQVSGGPEDDQGQRRRALRRGQPPVTYSSTGVSVSMPCCPLSRVTAWPPNWLRMAATSLLA